MIMTLSEPRMCELCGFRPATSGNRARYCELCQKADKHRHINRVKKQIITCVDCEGAEDPDGNMHLLTVSYGREDGSRESIHTDDSKKALLWLMNTTGEYNEMRQIYHAFHFNWDIGVLTKPFIREVSELMLIHKAGARNTNLLCYYKRTHEIGESHTPQSPPCEKIHRKDIKSILRVISNGGEGDIIAWDPKSCLAIASTPNRRLYVEHRPLGDRYDGWRSLDIHDHGRAFYGSLETVIDLWQPEITTEDREIITWGKKARKERGILESNPEKAMHYSEAECVADARCVRILINTIGVATGIIIKPSRLYGAGSLAGAAFDYHGMIKRKEVHDGGQTVSDLAELCYYGGIIETPVVGLVESAVDSEDINSAYPSHAIELPCMRQDHGRWIEGMARNIPSDSLIGYTKPWWNVKTPSTPPYVVHTTHKSVRQPLKGYGWVTIAEWRKAVKQFGPKAAGFDQEAYWWEQTCNCPNPLEWMKDLYNNRLNIKTSMKLAEYQSMEWQLLNVKQEAIKLVLVSCYGKLAQTRPEPGKYTNLHYAAYITGATRGQLRERTWRKEANGAVVVYQHTDSVKFVGGTLEDEGTTLGVWGAEKPKGGMIILQPGLAAPVNSTDKGASRGVDAQTFYTEARKWATETDLTQHPAKWPRFRVPCKRMISLRMAIHRGKPELAGNFTDMANGGMEIGPREGKRRLSKAIPMPGNPKAWIIPPVIEVLDQASLEELRAFRQSVTDAIEAGEFDHG
jgi:hypothetical protein